MILSTFVIFELKWRKMYKTILVPLDGSELAEGVLPYVKDLSRQTKAEISLLRIVEPTLDELKKYAKSNEMSTISSKIKSQASKYFDKVSDYLNAPGIKITSNLVEGVPAVEIISEASKNPDTLIAMSTHGRSGVNRWLIGSVADKVVRESATPLLLIRPKERSPIASDPTLKRVIVPLDESKFSEQVLPDVIYLASALNLQVILARVTPSAMDYAKWNTYDGVNWPASDMSEIARNVDEAATSYLKATAQKLSRQKISNVEQRLLHGDAASEIINLAAHTQDSFVAMTTRGRTGLSRSVLGSVADRVVRHCEEPVLLIRI